MSMQTPAEPRPLAVGMQVRAIDSEPVFASDPTSGDLGEIVEASSASYLVRWQSGAETWMQRAHLEPLAGAPAAPVTTAELPAPVAATVARGRYLVRYGGIILFGLLTARGWIPALADAVSHPTPRGVAAVALVLVVADRRHRVRQAPGRREPRRACRGEASPHANWRAGRDRPAARDEDDSDDAPGP